MVVDVGDYDVVIYEGFGDCVGFWYVEIVVCEVVVVCLY